MIERNYVDLGTTAEILIRSKSGDTSRTATFTGLTLRVVYTDKYVLGTNTM